ncbi:hypothetical protein PF005_g22576 [Phytophthora fragariae]|uniref:Uncharacterized protein n=1 Tax=Phytophthora fragariae TaxID=53985 RepID=A0A6A3E286_9STRA|nr:hypothetical protein PF003_g31396 [Phytophthora fragariae]KAE8926347.1 hypothetical protein PF009_g23464 [Phytophthora fragariae]KAE8983441.1 hypothetical protein PF011_g21186 [Phytophthora fragariae]KAE9081629.1 hypothetical protein PF007_g22586 [Phytophthora fragariae]KAE9082192.1 hypothetical protein PF010_g21690 [Phytophthora fragariae]
MRDIAATLRRLAVFVHLCAFLRVHLSKIPGTRCGCMSVTAGPSSSRANVAGGCRPERK